MEPYHSKQFELMGRDGWVIIAGIILSKFRCPDCGSRNVEKRCGPEGLLDYKCVDCGEKGSIAYYP